MIAYMVNVMYRLPKFDCLSLKIPAVFTGSVFWYCSIPSRPMKIHTHVQNWSIKLYRYVKNHLLIHRGA